MSLGKIRVGMQKLLKDFGLKPNNVMAIGDGLNDLELVKNSGFGVAMANAVPQVSSPLFFSYCRCLHIKDNAAFYPPIHDTRNNYL